MKRKKTYVNTVNISDDIIYCYERIKNDINGNPRFSGILIKKNEDIGYKINIQSNGGKAEIRTKIKNIMEEQNLYV